MTKSFYKPTYAPAAPCFPRASQLRQVRSRHRRSRLHPPLSRPCAVRLARDILDELNRWNEFECQGNSTSCSRFPLYGSLPATSTHHFPPALCAAPLTVGAYCQGDPHCRTFDGLSYDCHGDGEFVLLNSFRSGSVVHARFEPLLSQTTVSFTTAVAATEDGSPVVTVTVADGERTIMIGDEVYDGTIPSTVTGVSLDITDQDVRMVFRSGLEVNVRRWFTFEDSIYIGGVYVYAPVGMETVGILGTNNGDRGDDWTVRGWWRGEEGTVQSMRTPSHGFGRRSACRECLFWVISMPVEVSSRFRVLPCSDRAACKPATTRRPCCRRSFLAMWWR